MRETETEGQGQGEERLRGDVGIFYWRLLIQEPYSRGHDLETWSPVSQLYHFPSLSLEFILSSHKSYKMRVVGRAGASSSTGLFKVGINTYLIQRI